MTRFLQDRRACGFCSSDLCDASLRHLPDDCRVTSTQGDRIHNAECLFDDNYRRR